MTSVQVGPVLVEPARIVAVPEGLGELREEPRQEPALVLEEDRVRPDPLEALEAVGGARDALRPLQVVHGFHRDGRMGYHPLPVRTVGRRGSRTGGAYAFGRRGSRQYAQPPLMAPWIQRSNIGQSPFPSDESLLAHLTACPCHLLDSPRPAA